MRLLVVLVVMFSSLGVAAENIALLPSTVVIANSENAPRQVATNAVDGFPLGFPTDPTREWAATNNAFPSSAGGVGAFIELSWPEGYVVSQVSLWDRPNTSDRVLSGTLLFSDGSTVNVGALNNTASSPTVLDFSARTVTSVRFTVTGISGSTNNVGLAEIAVEGVLAQNVAPNADAGPNQSVEEGDNVTLNGSNSSDANNDPLTFLWTQSSGTPVSLSSQTSSNPSFTAPNGINDPIDLVFNLQVSDGSEVDNDSVTVTVNPEGQVQDPTNIALLSSVVVTANAENLPNQAAVKAVNGVAQGFPVDSTQEWAATNNGFPTPDGGTDAWIELSWPNSFLVDQVRLWDRPNTADQVRGGRLVFSDGSFQTVGVLPNNGATPLSITFAPRVINSVRFEIDQIGSNTNNVGLAEFEVIGVVAGNVGPVANAGADQSVGENETVNLNGSQSFDPNQDPISFSWQQIAGPSISLSGASSATPSFVSPGSVNGSAQITLRLTVSDGNSSDTDTVTVTVSDQQVPQNIALLPSVVVSANAENLPNQAAIKAVNGVAQGFPVDSTQEWAATNNPFPSSDGGTGAFLRLDWPSAFTVSQVSLWDRPNTADRVTGGTLTFSDGSSVPVGALPNNGATPTIVNFSPRNTEWVRFDVDQVSGSTNNVGLAEMAVQGFPAGNIAPVANAGPNQSVAQGASVNLNGNGSSDANEDPLNFTWTQTSGISVSLSGAGTATPSFTAPSGLSSNEVLVFNLAVSDGQLSDNDSVSITVQAGGGSGDFADAGNDQIARQGVSVELTGANTSEPGPLSFSWQQIGGQSVSITNSNSQNAQITTPSGASTNQTLTSVSIQTP